MKPQETLTLRGEVEGEWPTGNQKGVDRERMIRREWVLELKAGENLRKERVQPQKG